MTKPDLAALSEAAIRQACVEAGVVYEWYVWQAADRPSTVPPAIGDVEGLLYNAVTALARRIEAGCSGDLVLIDREGMRERKFTLGQRVTKIKGSKWTGRVVGFYSTDLTPVGYAIESENEPGSVQIYPDAAIAAILGDGEG